jgi:outer membrane receptor protein involved in Fe transport
MMNRKHMRTGRLARGLLAALLALACTAPDAGAQSRGKISGRVSDQSGTPLPGVNVVIVGTTLGSATDLEGDYFIANLEPGTYALRASFVGFREVLVEDVRVTTGRTTDVDITMTEITLEGEEIVVTATRPLVEADNTTSLVVLDAREVTTRPTSEFTDVLTTLPGINVEDGQVLVRGAELSQVAFMMDGARVRNPVDHTPYTRMNLSSIQEVEVITGAFNAEYGEAQSGVINVVTRDGSRGLSMYLDTRYTPPGVRHWGSAFYDRSDPKYWENTHALHPEWWEEYPDQWTDPNGIKGSDPASVWTPQEAYRNYLDTHVPLTDYDEAPTYQTEVGLGMPVPGLANLSFFATGKFRSEPPLMGNAYRNRGEFFDGTLKVAWRLSGGRKLSFSGFVGTEKAGWGFWPDLFWLSVYARDSRYAFFDQAGLDDVSTNGQAVTYTRVLDEASMYEIRASRLSAFRKNGVFPDDPLGFEASDATRDPVTGTDEFGNAVPPYRIGYHTSGYLAIHENTNREYTLAGFYSSQLSKVWNLKTGLELIAYDLDHYNHSKYPSPSTDSTTYRPYQGATYVQNKFEFGGLITNVGLRLDFYNPNATVYEDLFDPLNGPTSKSKLFAQLSPRIGVSHPIDERTVLHFTYGHFFQRPSFFDDGEGLGTASGSLSTLTVDGADPPVAVVLGNRDLRPRKTISFEVGIERNFWNVLVVDVTGFYNDSRNTIRTVEINTPQGTYRTNGNGDYGDVRGVEISARKVPSTYPWGTFSAYGSFTSRIEIEGRSGDPVAITPTRVLYGSSGDNIMHQNPRAKAGFFYQAPPDLGGIAGIALNNTSVSIDFEWVFPNENLRSDYFFYDGHKYMRPVDTRTRLKARREIRLSDGKVRLSPYLEVTNLFNSKWVLLSTFERASLADQAVMVESGFETLPDHDANGVPILDLAKYRNLPRAIQFGVTVEL